MTGKYLRTALAATLLFPGLVLAEGAYIGLGVGQSKLHVVESICDTVEAFRTPGTTANCRAEDTDTSVSLFGGYGFNRHFALELGYMDLGEGTSDTQLIAGGRGATVNGRISVTGVYLAGIGKLLIGERASLFAKVGVFEGDAESHVSVSVSGLPVDANDASGSGSELLYGFGVDFSASERVGVRLLFERIDTDDPIDNIMLALIGRF